MTNKAILDYNQSLLLTDSRPDIIEYIKHINTLNNEPIDLSFMEKLLSLIEKDECCIPHTLLVDYGAFGKNNASTHVRETLEAYDFIEGKEFKLSVNRELENNGKHYNKKLYELHPDTFKFLLMRSRNENKYAKYYLLLEKCVKYYHDFQNMYKDFMLKQKDTTIDSLEKKVDELLDQNKEVLKKNDELLANTRDIKEDLSNLIDFSVDQAEQNELSESKIRTVVTDRIDRPHNENNIEQLLLFTYNDSYYVVRGILSYVIIRYKQLTQNTFLKESKTDYKLLKHFENMTNARYLFIVMKERYNIKPDGNYFSTHLDPINIIQEIIDNRYTINIKKEDLVTAKKKATKKVLTVLNK